MNHDQVVELAKSLPELKSMPKSEFVLWVRDNPKIYEAFRRFALDAVRAGRSRFSAYMIRERVRWYTNIEYGGKFKISNNVTPYVSRLLAEEIPILKKIFARKEVEQQEFEQYKSGDLF